MDKTYKAQLATSFRHNKTFHLVCLFLIVIIIIIYILKKNVSGLMDNAYLIPSYFLVFHTAPWTPKEYTISNNAIHIKKGKKYINILLENISKTEVIDGRFVFNGDIHVSGSSGLVRVGLLQGRKLPSFIAYASNDKRLVVLYRKHNDPIVISPDEPEDFVNVLKTTYGIECVINEETNEERVPVHIPFSKSDKVMEYISGMIATLTIGCICYFWSKLPNLITTHYDAVGNPNRWGNKTTVLLEYALSMIGVYVLFRVIEYYMSNKKVFLSCADEVINSPSPIRLILKIVKIYVLFAIGYNTWQTGLIALGIIKDKGMGFSVLMLFAAFLLIPVFLIIAGLGFSKNDNFAERNANG